MRSMGRLGQVWRRLESRFVNGGVILLYHSIADAGPDPFALQVSPGHFAEQIEVLRSETHVLPLLEFVQRARENCLPRRAVAVTFDDGYADNLLQAAPILQSGGVPATIFVATGPAVGRSNGHPRRFWWDELAQMVPVLENVMPRPRLVVGGQVLDTEGLDRESLRRKLYHALRALQGEDRDRCLALLRESLKGDRMTGGESVGEGRRCLTPQEIIELGSGHGAGLVQIGAHTVHHSALVRLSIVEQRREICESRAYLEEILGRRIEAFSYPYGQRSDYTLASAAVVRQLGFKCACSAFPGVTWRGSDMYQLPRIWIRDWDGDAFSRQLATWLRPKMGSGA